NTVIDNSIPNVNVPTQVKKGESYSSDGTYIDTIWGVSANKNNTTAIKHDYIDATDTDTLSDVVWSWGDNNHRQLGNMIDGQAYMPVQSGEREVRRVVVLHIDKYNTSTGGHVPYYISLPVDTKDISLVNRPEIDLTTDEYLIVDNSSDETGIWEIYERGFILEGSGSRTRVTNATLTSSNTNVAKVTNVAPNFRIDPGTNAELSSAVITVTNNTTNTEAFFSVRITRAKDAKTSAVISAGYNHTVLLKEDGTVWSWGDNYYSQMANGNYNSHGADELYPLGGSITGGGAGAGKADYLHRDFTYMGTGDLDITAIPTEARVSASEKLTTDSRYVVSVAAASNYTVAATNDGNVYLWGTINSTTYYYATKFTAFSNIISVAAGYEHFLALSSDGYVYAWGKNDKGQLGDNTNINVFDTAKKTQTVAQAAEDQVDGKYLYNITQISAFGNTSAALRSDGTVWTWGDNSSAQLGDGTTTNKITPVQVRRGESTPDYAATGASDNETREENANYNVYLQDVDQISVGLDHMIAVTHTHDVYVWGDNTYGQFGTDTVAMSYFPVKVDTSAFFDTDEIAASVYAGKHYSAIITTDGHMYTSGSNMGTINSPKGGATNDSNGDNGIGNGAGAIAATSYGLVGKLGTGSDENSVTEFKAVTTGLKYQLDDSLKMKNDPTEDDNRFTDIRYAFLSDDHAVVITKYGYVWGWGANDDYQLGDITNNISLTPVVAGEKEARYMIINEAVLNGTKIADTPDGVTGTLMPAAVTIDETDTLIIKKVTYIYNSGFNVNPEITSTDLTTVTPVYDVANSITGTVGFYSSDESVAKVKETANGIEVSTELTRRYSNTTITVQNKTNGAVGMFVLNVKRKETTDTKKPVIAVPMVAVGDDFSIALRS
ncbi:MAG: hypothetical protein IJI48_02165, partial [Ruminococcus sp.]|nr:hypothetical protein [Ruminococcus sp.]